jgi:hypothetical protein
MRGLKRGGGEELCQSTRIGKGKVLLYCFKRTVTWKNGSEKLPFLNPYYRPSI